MGSPRMTRLLERTAIVVASLVISIGVIAVLSGGLLAGNDSPGVSSGGPLGVHYRDLGRAHLAPGSAHPAYNSDPPTSGAHLTVAVRRDESRISDDQLLQALEVGDVVVMYGTRSPPPGLKSLATALASPFTPALAAAGQAVILVRRPGTIGLLGVAWTRLLHAASAADPSLHSFVLYWLGRGAPRR